MRDQTGFDQWADEYDKAVDAYSQEDKYPFAGYEDILGSIYRIITQKPGAVVLDIGFGTGNLTSKLYNAGCTVFGQDFSERMIELAQAKMPGAHLYKGDFSQGLVEPLRDRKYDFITATYAMHHLDDERKISFLRDLLGCLNPGGRILIGDIAFENREAMDRCRADTGDEWDDEEYYFAADELKSRFPNLTFTKISVCAGIISLCRED